MSPGEPPDPPVPPGARFWSHMRLWWATAGLAGLLGVLLPLMLKSDPPPNVTPPPSLAGPTSSGPSSSPPATPPSPPPTTPRPTTPVPTTPRVSATVVSVLSQGQERPGFTRVQVNVTFTGLKGRTVYITWRTYNDATKQSISSDSTVRSPALGWDVTNWHPLITVANPTVRWQIQVTAYGPDGVRLATNHSNFAFSS
ncbi:hypothetical protein I5Q34_03845 [Streptomyces sp. AV19]|uniref:hypothetical protein n=1 Tax=Streptomyces sp. AV19 TaxID=2793068 RepID=UPI0018FF0EE3|nr:hypothetical protein [Streptomyces sp. AV19]MBH1933426.1 hypothetical protein [Streptomyces sp. AV19]MDG4532075.1 hypothetical protein [Streptomyces sp. AV19]